MTLIETAMMFTSSHIYLVCLVYDQRSCCCSVVIPVSLRNFLTTILIFSPIVSQPSCHSQYFLTPLSTDFEYMRFITTIKQYSLHGDILCKVAEATSQQSAPPEKKEKKDKKKVNPGAMHCEGLNCRLVDKPVGVP